MRVKGEKIMAKKTVFNANYVEVMGAVIANEGKGYSRELAGRLPQRTFNSVNATLATMAGKGFLTKVKGVYNEKLLTLYTITAEGQKAFDEATGEVVEEIAEDIQDEDIQDEDIEDEFDEFEDDDEEDAE